jgi:hypothetical protein
MRRSVAGLVLTLLVTGCAAPQVGEAEDGAESSRVVGVRGKVLQEAARPMTPPLGRVTPAAGFTLLPRPPILPRARPALVKPSRSLQCVPYARELSGVKLRGDAWTWWNKAEGRYARGAAPRPGAVLVLSKSQRLRRGHLAVVAEVRSSREIVVHQANWLNGGWIHRYSPVRDVSQGNDWSEVRVWYTPGRVYGSRTYAASGFIYPQPESAPVLRQVAK